MSMNKYIHGMLALAEAGRSVVDYATLHLDRDLFQSYNMGSTDPVLIIPGYHCKDEYTTMFQEFLTRLGYTVYGWEQGINFAQMYQFTILRRHLLRIYKKHQKPVRLIGYSLGGLYARKLASEHPEAVHSVVTVGAPIYQDVEGSSMRFIKLFAKLAGADSRIQEFLDCIDEHPKVLTTVIYSKTDGIVHWRDALDKVSGPNLKHICITGSHVGMMFNPMVWRTIRQTYQFH